MTDEQPYSESWEYRQLSRRLDKLEGELKALNASMETVAGALNNIMELLPAARRAIDVMDNNPLMKLRRSLSGNRGHVKL